MMDHFSLTAHKVKVRLTLTEDRLHQLCDRMAFLLKEIQALQTAGSQNREKKEELRYLKKSYNLCYQDAFRTSEELKDLEATHEILKNRSTGRLWYTATVA